MHLAMQHAYFLALKENPAALFLLTVLNLCPLMKALHIFCPPCNSIIETDVGGRPRDSIARHLE